MAPDRIIEGARTLLITASSIPSVANLQPETCRQALGQIAAQLEQYRTILVLDLEGNVICDSRPAPAL